MTRKQVTALVFLLSLSLALMGGGAWAQKTWESSENLPQTVVKLLPTQAVTPVEKVEKQHFDVAIVTRVIDGDTIEIATGQKVRYIGIDTPETVHPQKAIQCYGKAASTKNTELVEHKTVYLVKDVSETDRYGRLLRYVYLSPEASFSAMVNAQLVAEGFAKASSYPPDVRYQKEFQALEMQARTVEKGLWGSECKPN